MDISSLPTRYEGEYIDITDLSGNKSDIKLLSKAYASCGSELTAVLQYSFQSFVTSEPEIKKLLNKISMTEMHHLKQLGEAIVKLGGVPYYTNGNLGDYTTACVYEGSDIKTMLEQNIQDEKAAISYYEYIKQKLSSDSLRKLIDRLLLDEMVHIDTFGKMLEYVSFYKE